MRSIASPISAAPTAAAAWIRKIPHPHGKSPALKDGDTLVWESTAIALYLTDRFPQNGLGPVVGDPKRGAYVSWLAYYAGVMEPAWMSAYMKWEIPRGTAGWVKTDEVMEFVNATLEQGPYILGEKFSAVDILVGTTFKMFLGSPMLEKTAAAGGLCQAGDRAGRPMPAPRPKQ